jgi:aspartyl/asparaginyl beta-hydroxylase (cupin superfamily)
MMMSPFMRHDDIATSIIDLLRSQDADRLPHGGGRALLEHLLGTYSIVCRWGQPAWLQHAALIHSVYGTDAYQRQLLPLSARTDVAAVAGDRAERIAFLFSVTPRGPLLAGTHRWARGLPAGSTDRDHDASLDPPTREELDAVVLLHMANLAEQARSADGSPGRWLSALGELAELLDDAEELKPPLFMARLGTFSDADEALIRRVYREAVGLGDDPERRASRFALAASACSVIAEPAVWLAYLSRLEGDIDASRAWTAQARDRLLELGTPWDKRVSFEGWSAMIDAIEQPPDGKVSSARNSITHPRALLEAITEGSDTSRAAATGLADYRAPIEPPDAATGRKRFQRYIEGVAGASGFGAVYPDLPSRPWHDPAGFPLVGYLESNYAAIRNEILTLDAAGFHRESERIARSGDWDVAFLYERGRRHDRVCAACPVTTRGVESYPTIRTSAGLIYISRLRGGTHIEAHRGPTNLRVRCHLALRVPVGDCGIRVGEDTRHWEEGRCLVFDDYFDHEAWNHSDEDRLVLIIDLWHPGLSLTEVTLLERLHTYTYDQARRLSRYWSANAAAARQGGEQPPHSEQP